MVPGQHSHSTGTSTGVNPMENKLQSAWDELLKARQDHPLTSQLIAAQELVFQLEEAIKAEKVKGWTKEFDGVMTHMLNQIAG